jgi:hypothetical protein
MIFVRCGLSALRVTVQLFFQKLFLKLCDGTTAEDCYNEIIL